MTAPGLYGIAIVGCGRIGEKRAATFGIGQLKACVDLDIERARDLAQRYQGCQYFTTLEAALQNVSVQIVVVATTNDALFSAASTAIKAGKHVLLEKPAGRCVGEVEELIQLAARHQVLLRVGFNHRYHPALIKAKEIQNQGLLGEMMMIRGRYGHGGRLGYEKEWRADPKRSGGGELLDQGVHLIDLARLFLGEFTEVQGCAQTLYWDMPVDDNAFLILKTNSHQVAFLQVSCSEWKNLFSFEIYGKKAKLQVDGLGGSYGVERLTYYQMLPEMGPPLETVWEYPGADSSWQTEFAEFEADIALGRLPQAGAQDALASMKIVRQIYKSSGYDHCS